LDKLPLPSTRKFEKAQTNLSKLFDTLVESAKTSTNKLNILSHMLGALDNNEEGKPTLNKSELMSNIFVLFVAGVYH